MKQKTGAPVEPAQAVDRRAWIGYGAGFLAFAAGLALLVGDRLVLGGLVSLVGISAVTATYLNPLPRWRSVIAAWRETRPAAAAAGSPDFRAPVQSAPRGGLIEVLLSRLDPSDTWSLNRLYLLAPAVVFLIASALLAVSSTVQGAAAFIATVMVVWVYLQDMTRPLVIPNLRRNIRALLAQTPALPTQCLGIWLLNNRYDHPAMVWTGFFICAASSGYMYFALQRLPFDLTESGAEKPVLGWTPPKPFATIGRLSFITGLAALSGVTACLAVYVFPGDHALLSVFAGFAAMALLVGTFPWFPSGLAFAPQVPAALGAVLAVGAAAVAFALGAHGQDRIEAGAIGSGMWLFLAGGVVLVLGLSRFAADRGREDTVEAAAWPKLEMAAVLLLVLAAFAFRIWKIGRFPFGVEGDEGGGGVWAMDTLTGNVENQFIHQNYPLAFFSVTAFFFKIAGVTLATLRWHSVFFGTLSIATTYFFLRLNMGRAAAFLCTLLMSFSYWHLHYSRFGHYNIEQVAVQMAAFYFVFKGMRTGKLWHWAVGGAAFGLAMFPHMAGRILPFEGIALLVFLFLGRRELLRGYFPGFLAFVLLAWAVSSPALVYWNRARGASMGRISSVSIFDKNNTNAPVDTLGGFVSNCKVSMLMFNYQGDTRSRDNPVAPDKILEHWSAVLFGLAFLYVLYHWREPVNFFLLGVFFLNLCASIFSVEAPQTLRTAGNIPIVFAFMAVPLADLEAALRRTGRFAGRAAFLVLLVAFAFFSWRSARRLFVDEKRLSFDTEATYIAQVAGREGGVNTQGVFWGTGFASSHPPMLLFKLNTPLRNFYGPFEYLPITQATDRDNLLFLSDDYQKILPYVHWLYPKAEVRPIPGQEGDPALAQYIRVNKDMIEATQGLNGDARIGAKPISVTGMDPDWPLAGMEQARAIAVEGSVSLDQFGHHSFSVTGKGDAKVTVDGKVLFSRRSGRVEQHDALLAKGLHDLALRLDPASASDVMHLQESRVSVGGWGSPNATGAQMVDVDKAHVLQLRASGFYAEYFPTRVPGGQAAIEIVEPVVLNHWLDPPLVGNWSVRWRTRFRTTVPGLYRFSVAGGNSSQAKVDGKTVWRVGTPLFVQESAKPALPGVQLSPGWHDYEAIFSTSGGPGCDLDWVTPDGKSGTFWLPDMQPLH